MMVTGNTGMANSSSSINSAENIPIISLDDPDQERDGSGLYELPAKVNFFYLQDMASRQTTMNP
jgi:hypothetical protein